QREARASMEASRSRPITRPVGLTRSASKRVCPPAPVVASTTTCPGCGSRSASTSAGSTETWRGNGAVGSLMGVMSQKVEERGAGSGLFRWERLLFPEEMYPPDGCAGKPGIVITFCLLHFAFSVLHYWM